MGSKDTKPGSRPKPKKEDEAEIQDKVALGEAKARVKVLKSAVDGIRAQIKAEREEATHDPSVTQARIQAQIDRARLNWEKVQSELSQAKGLSRKRKDEIDEWKAWYEGLSTAEKPAGLERLQGEIAWRANELASNGEKINELIRKEFEARGVLEMARLRLTAFQEGVHKSPMEEDPRLKGALAELDKATAAVARLEPRRKKRE